MTEYNKEQEEVIRITGGQHLVLAPPGCGKTAVLAERIVRARQQGVPFSDMACLTFTNRAARGMRERILSRFNVHDELFVGNVHRFCSRFLFEQGIVPETTAIIDTDMSISISLSVIKISKRISLSINFVKTLTYYIFIFISRFFY